MQNYDLRKDLAATCYYIHGLACTNTLRKVSLAQSLGTYVTALAPALAAAWANPAIVLVGLGLF